MNHTQSEITKNASPHSLLPQNTNIEEALLSAILRDNNILLDIADRLSPDDFYDPANQKIFEVAAELFAKNITPDFLTVGEILKEKGDLEKVGGDIYITWLADEVPMAVNPVHHAKIIRDKACQRNLIRKASEIAERCRGGQGTIEEIIDFAERSILEISEERVTQAFHSISDLVDTALEIIDSRRNNKGMIIGVPTGFSKLDEITAGLQPSDLIILAARPSMGKTAFALNIARNAAVDGGVPVALFSLEMSKEQLVMRMLCTEAEVDSSRLRTGVLSREDWDRINDAGERLSEFPIYIDDTASISDTEVRAKARRLKKSNNIGLIIIDYLQLMRSRSSTERRDLEIAEISRGMKALAKELQVPVIALSQLNRKLEERGDKRPILSDLRESGSLEQDSDVVAFIYRDEVYNKDENNPNRGIAEIIVSKQRNGPIGTVKLAFINKFTRFGNLSIEYQ